MKIYTEKQVKELWTKENIERWFSTSQKISEILPPICCSIDVFYSLH